MCGIIYVEGQNGADVKNELTQRFANQRHRGTDGFGFVAIKDGKVIAFEKAEEEEEIFSLISAVGDMDSILFHHRIPTSTPNYAGTAHPFKVTHKTFQYDYYVIHNGVVTNTDALKLSHEHDGFVYQSQYMTPYGAFFPFQKHLSQTKYTRGKHNDSESIAIEIALFLEGGQNEINADGGAAIIGLQVVKDTNEVESVFYGRNGGRPLVFENHSAKKLKKNKPSVFTIKSEGKGHVLNENCLFVRDYKTKKEIMYSVLLGNYSTPRTYPVGYGQYNLPEPKKTDFSDKNDDLYSRMTLGDLETEIQSIEDRMDNLRVEKEDWAIELANETDLAARGQIRRKMLEIESELKSLQKDADDVYFYATGDMYT